MEVITILDGVEVDAQADIQTAQDFDGKERILEAMQHVEMTTLVFFITDVTGAPIVDVDPQVRKTRPGDGTDTFWSKIPKGTGVADYVQLNISSPSVNDYFTVDLPRMGKFDQFRFDLTVTTLGGSDKFTVDAWLEIATSIKVG